MLFISGKLGAQNLFFHKKVSGLNLHAIILPANYKNDHPVPEFIYSNVKKKKKVYLLNLSIKSTERSRWSHTSVFIGSPFRVLQIANC